VKNTEAEIAEISVLEWKERVLDLCKKTGVSMVEVSQMPGAEGEYSLWSAQRQNVVLWMCLKENLVNAICELLASRQIEACSTTALIYFCDGARLNLPLAQPGKRGYKAPHWLPIALNLPKKPS
jgi:hypothetical protein